MLHIILLAMLKLAESPIVENKEPLISTVVGIIGVIGVLMFITITWIIAMKIRDLVHFTVKTILSIPEHIV
jgi:hypothetical protein